MSPTLARPAIDVGVVVANLPAALQFYRDTLGLPVRTEITVPGVGRMAILAAGQANLKLVEPGVPIEHHPAPGGVRGRAAGLRYCTFPVEDVAGALERCAAAGRPIVMPLTEIGDSQVAAVTDPDGNWIEFIAAAPATAAVTPR